MTHHFKMSRREMLAMSAAAGGVAITASGRGFAQQPASRIEQLDPALEKIISTSEPIKSIAECASQEPYSTQIGPFGKALMAEQYTDSGVPVLRGVNVNQGRFHDHDFVFIDDVCQALLAALRRPPARARTLDIGSGVSSSIADMAALIARHYRAPEPRITSAFRPGDVRHALTDSSAARAELGYSPAVALPEGLRRLCEWVDGELVKAS